MIIFYWILWILFCINIGSVISVLNAKHTKYSWYPWNWRMIIGLWYVKWAWDQKDKESLAKFDKLTQQRLNPNTPTQARVNAYREEQERKMDEWERQKLDEYLGDTKFTNFLASLKELK